MDRSLACIVIPVYREKLSVNETNALLRCFEIYGSKLDIILIGPKNLKFDTFEHFGNFKQYVQFNNSFFKSSYSYNSLLLSSKFYSKFLNYNFILIYQLDAFILNDSVEKFCSLNYDFIGAPWIKGHWKNEMDKKYNTRFFSKFFLAVGNGGFSLRKVKKAYIISLLTKPLLFFWKRNWNEDIFWSTLCYRFIPGYKLPSFKEALMFSFEDCPSDALLLNGSKLPFGCHAWEKNEPEFWKPIFKKLGYEMKI